MTIKMKRCVLLFILISGFVFSCSDYTMEYPSSDNRHVIEITGGISQEYATRACDGGFEDCDRTGVYVVDYVGNTPGLLTAERNHATNVSMVYSQATGRWTSDSPLYWKDEKTHIDVYGYYPYDSYIESVDEYEFTVSDDQACETDQSGIGGYEKSDFLWAKAVNVSPKDGAVYLTYTHGMAGIKVTLQQGTGFTGDEWNEIKKVVTINGLKRKALINLATGKVTAVGDADRNIIMSAQVEDTYRAVVVPQSVSRGFQLIGITIDGTSYCYTTSEDISLASSKMCSFTLKVDKKEGGDYSIMLVSQGINEWENDQISHGYSSTAYTVIHCSQEGTLRECIANTGKKSNNILNLKITGRLNSSDFEFIRNEMTVLQGLNLSETVTIGSMGWYHNIYGNGPLQENNADMFFYAPELKEYEEVLDEEVPYVFPQGALKGKLSLKYLILPNTVRVLGFESLADLELSPISTLIIPNSVIAMADRALCGLKDCNLVLPDYLVAIGDEAMSYQTARYDIKLPSTLKFIGYSAFWGSRNATGRFSLPEQLSFIGSRAFFEFGNNLSGDIIIPATMKELRDCFSNMGFVGGINLVFHDSLQSISGGFSSFTLNNYIRWPRNLKYLGSFSNCDFRSGIGPLPEGIQLGPLLFLGCKFHGEVVLPSDISGIPRNSFWGTDISTIDIKDNVQFIGEHAFSNCMDLQYVRIGKYVDNIEAGAFQSCMHLNKIVCLNPNPPQLYQDVFLGCDLEHLVLEVPQAAVSKYKNADGWKNIKYITAHHELALSIKDIRCLDKGTCRNMIVRSEGAWEVVQCPSWCHISQISSDINTTEISVSVEPSSLERSGEITLKLKSNDYTASCQVTQLLATSSEDVEIVLQSASVGEHPIPIFIVGDGFTADMVSNGTYLERCIEQMEYFFAIEPYKTYRAHFTVTTALAVSPEAGISSVDLNLETKFDSTDDPTTGLRCDVGKLREYVIQNSSVIGADNISKALIMVVVNKNNFMGNQYIDTDGMTVAMNTLSVDTYPYDTRGLVQRHAGGGFGRLASEEVSEMEYLKNCSRCYKSYQKGSAQGWYRNITVNNAMAKLPWKHLIFDPRYSDIVDIYEGGFNHLRGVFRSEKSSCMSDYTQYYNSYSRELIVRRIKELSGEEFDFEDFVSNDSREGLTL